MQWSGKPCYQTQAHGASKNYRSITDSSPGIRVLHSTKTKPQAFTWSIVLNMSSYDCLIALHIKTKLNNTFIDELQLLITSIADCSVWLTAYNSSSFFSTGFSMFLGTVAVSGMQLPFWGRVTELAIWIPHPLPHRLVTYISSDQHAHFLPPAHSKVL